MSIQFDLKSIHFQNIVYVIFYSFKTLNKVLSLNLLIYLQLTSAEVPCFESNEDCAKHCFKNKWTLIYQLFFVIYLTANFYSLDPTHISIDGD